MAAAPIRIPAGDLHIEATYSPRSAVVRCAGEIDASNILALREALAAWAETGVPELEVDLREVTYLDSETVETLVWARQQLAQQEGRLRVQARPNGMRLLRLLRMDRIMEIVAA